MTEDDPDPVEDSQPPPDSNSANAPESDDDSDWRFSLEDLEESTPETDSFFRGEVEPGSPDIENTVFVLLGVALGLFVVVQLLF